MTPNKRPALPIEGAYTVQTGPHRKTLVGYPEATLVELAERLDEARAHEGDADWVDFEIGEVAHALRALAIGNRP
ncbi:MAG: hypothetical protein AAGI34_06000 [Pseudomonadota bacterium]